MTNPIINDKPDEYWRAKLTPEQYRIAREKGTEAPFSGEFINNHKDGTYHCIVCGYELFASDTKFDSGSGWPSFTDPINVKNVLLSSDSSLGMQRTEVQCANCGAHLGHVFEDGPVDKGGNRYCINSVSLDFLPKK